MKKFQEFNDDTSNLISALYNYTPKTFANRKTNAQKYMDKKGLNELFPKRQLTGNAGDITSKLEDVKVYSKAIQGSNIAGIVEVTYKSKYTNDNYIKGRSFLEVTYNTDTHKVSHLKMVDNKTLY